MLASDFIRRLELAGGQRLTELRRFYNSALRGGEIPDDEKEKKGRRRRILDDVDKLLKDKDFDALDEELDAALDEELDAALDEELDDAIATEGSNEGIPEDGK